MKSFIPRGDRVLINPKEDISVSAGGILIPDSARRDVPTEGTIVAKGPGKTLPDGTVKTMDLKKGQVVYYSKYGGQEVVINNHTYILIPEELIYGIVEHDDPVPVTEKVFVERQAVTA